MEVLLTRHGLVVTCTRKVNKGIAAAKEARMVGDNYIKPAGARGKREVYCQGDFQHLTGGKGVGGGTTGQKFASIIKKGESGNEAS